MNQASMTLKETYKAIPISSGLDNAIAIGLKRAKRKQKRTYNAIAIAASLVIAFSAFTTALNISPAFADSLSELPFIGKIFEKLIFTEGQARGGTLTDGSDIESMQVIKADNTESFMIHFTSDGSDQTDANAFQVKHYSNPQTLQFDISGARMMSATADFELIKSLGFVKEVYTLITLDDSLIRFNIVLNEDVYAEVSQVTEPGGLLVTLSPIEASESVAKIYSIRTYSQAKTESFAQIEESLFWSVKDMQLEDYRIMKDDQGDFLYELGQFDSQEQADKALNKIEAITGLSLLVEERQGDQVPAYIQKP